MNSSYRNLFGRNDVDAGAVAAASRPRRAVSRICALLSALLVLLMLGACALLPGGGETPSQQPAERTATDTAAEGSQEGSAASVEVSFEQGSVTLTNKTEYTIDEIGVLSPGSGEILPGNSFTGLALPVGESVTLEYLKCSESGLYDIRCVTDQMGIIYLNNVDLNARERYSIEFSEGIGYTSYLDEESQEIVDTFQEASEANVNAGESGEQTYDMENQRG